MKQRKKSGQTLNQDQQTESEVVCDGEKCYIVPKKQDDFSSNPYWLTRAILVRSCAFIYFVAFLSAFFQADALIGTNGLYPFNLFLQRVKSHYGVSSNMEAFLQLPTLLWFVDEQYYDTALQSIITSGLVLSVLAMFGFTTAWIMFLLWFLYMSLENIGQLFYGYGWESQLLETGFLCIWLCPLTLRKKNIFHEEPSYPIVLLQRWLIIRIMFGAGLIKIRGDSCWRDLTCMVYHYETQPIPNPLSWWLHQAPFWFQAAGVLVNHFVELIVPWFLFLPFRYLRHFAGICLVGFQILLILSGNLSFLNWLTIVPCLACFDDGFWLWFVPNWVSFKTRYRLFARQHTANIPTSWTEYFKMKTVGWWIHSFFVTVVTCLVIYLSMNPVANLFSDQQAMNRSFDSFKLVNTYGAFGSVGKVRNEVILQGTTDKAVTDQTKWIEYEFKCKPGDVSRTPCVRAPYHHRLDWQIWFAAMSSYQHQPWLIHFTAKLLANDPVALALIESNPFQDQPPTFIRAELYQYQYTAFEEWWNGNTSDWWVRKRKQEYFSPLSLENTSLRNYLRQYGWTVPKAPKHNVTSTQ